MGEVSLDLQNNITTNFVPKTISDFLKIVALIDNANEKVLKLKDFVKRLEDEMNKVDAFKRELPLCMLLLNDAIQGLKDEVVQCTALSNSSPRLEELVLLKKESDEGDGSGDKKDNECADKKSWIGSLKLCSNGSDGTNNSINDKLETKGNEGCNGSATGDLFKTGRDLSAGGAFVPFKALSGIPASASRKDENKLPVHELSLLAPGVENREQIGSIGAKTSPGRAERSYAQTLQSRVGSQQQQQPARKQRRCWSQELHKRFVNALQQLGGAQVATPKQIRELMHVDGLTNDEVKSHLQKYRLHIQRLSSAKASPANQSMGVLGGLSMSGDQYADSTKPSIPHSNSPQGPLQLAGNGGGTSTTGDSMDDDEDEKSDSHSWKSHFYKQGKDDV